MAFVPLQNFGKFGVIADTLNSVLPVGSWTDARNIRFSGAQMEKMLEPSLLIAFDDVLNGPLEWMQAWSDGLTTYLTVATRQKLWFLQRNSAIDVGTWVDVTRAGGPYSVDGIWDSFSWGDTCIWNNGEDPPQIFNPSLLIFEDLPNWGLVSNPGDIAVFGPPSRNTNASCKILKPYKNYLVAFGITESEVYQPNSVWWSDATTLSSYMVESIEGGGPPLWDYESPATLSGKSEVGVGSGEITCVCTLNENLVVYCENSATLMTAVGGSFVMSFRRLFNKGAAGQKCAVEFNNSNFVLSRDQIYLHDGSQVNLIAKDRVEEEFFKRIGKSGRFGGVDTIDWEGIQVSQNPDRKEISIIYNRIGDVHVPEIGGAPALVYPTVDAGGPYSGLLGISFAVDGTVTPGDFTIDSTLWTWTGVGENRLFPEPGDNITATLVNTGAVSGGPESYLGVYQNKILYKKFVDQFVYSDDYGATWTTMGLVPLFASNFRCHKLAYHVASGFWFMLTVNSTADMNIYRSTDNGLTWTPLTMPSSTTYSTTSMIIDSSDRLLFTARSGLASPNDGMWLWRWDTPDVSLTFTTSLRWASSAHNIDNLKEVPGYGYAISRWTGTVQNVQLVPYDMLSSTQITAGLLTSGSGYDNIPWSEALDGKLYAWHTLATGNPRFLAIFNGMTSTPELLTRDFTENSEAHRIQAGPDYLLMLSQPDAASSVWRLAYSYDGVTWVGEVNLLLPIDSATDTGSTALNLYKAGGDIWVATYVNGTTVQLITFPFGPSFIPASGFFADPLAVDTTFTPVTGTSFVLRLRAYPTLLPPISDTAPVAIGGD
jgi:hypothetical protein